MEKKFTINDQRVIGVVLSYPTHRFTVREMSRLTKITHPTVSRSLQKLNKLGLAKRELQKNMSGIGTIIFWVANREGEKYKLYKKIANLEQLYFSALIEKIASETTPNAIILFGSYSRGEDTEESDIDLFVISKEKQINLKGYEQRLHRKINITFETDIKKLSKEFLNNIINGIILYGYLEVIK